jgi:hypothetical protein
LVQHRGLLILNISPVAENWKKLSWYKLTKLDAGFRVDDVDIFNWSRSEIAYPFYCGFESHLDYKKIKDMELNEFGKRVWKHKTNKRLFLEQSYIWKERLTLIDEFEDERNVVMTFELNSFDFSSWTPMMKEEFDSIKSQYKEIYN